jgi:hypothetical protein
MHRQSPVDLQRNPAVIGDPAEKECPDWHYMQHKADSCTWEDMVNKDTFKILRSSLRINIPITQDGEIDCVDPVDGERRFPRLDYSKGFPDWWLMDHIDLSVPGHHGQEGKLYPAELTLAHYYEKAHDKNQVSGRLDVRNMRPEPNVLICVCCSLARVCIICDARLCRSRALAVLG